MRRSQQCEGYLPLAPIHWNKATNCRTARNVISPSPTNPGSCDAYQLRATPAKTVVWGARWAASCVHRLTSPSSKGQPSRTRIFHQAECSNSESMYCITSAAVSGHTGLQHVASVECSGAPKAAWCSSRRCSSKQRQHVGGAMHREGRLVNKIARRLQPNLAAIWQDRAQCRPFMAASRKWGCDQSRRPGCVVVSRAIEPVLVGPEVSGAIVFSGQPCVPSSSVCAAVRQTAGLRCSHLRKQATERNQEPVLFS